MSKGCRSRAHSNDPILMGEEITGTGKVRGRLGPSLQVLPFTRSRERQGFEGGNGMTRFAQTQVALTAMSEARRSVRVLQQMRGTCAGAECQVGRRGRDGWPCEIG